MRMCDLHVQYARTILMTKFAYMLSLAYKVKYTSGSQDWTDETAIRTKDKVCHMGVSLANNHKHVGFVKWI